MTHGRWSTDGSDDAKLIPVQILDEPMEEPLLGPIIRPWVRPQVRPVPKPTAKPGTKPFHGTIDIPPIVVPNAEQFDRPTNPFPDRPECVEE
jgi:hypothetical protein